MPLYTYTCKDHGTFEEFKTISDRHVAFCPVCGEGANFSVSPFSFRFSGEVSPQVARQLSKGVMEDTKDWRWDSKQLEQVM